MEIKDLNKVQLILLALLLSFVTSLATGITTVTLMQQAPTSVTVPINRVVRETVEKIVSVEGKTTVQTVVVKEEDLVVDAISKNQTAIFKVNKEVSGTSSEVSAGQGVVVSSAGLVAVDAMLVPGGETYFLENASGKFKAEFVSANEAGFSFLKVGDSVEGTTKAVFNLPTLGDITKMKAGQKIIFLGNPIASFIYEGKPEIKLDVTNTNAGGLVLNLDGDVLGMATLDVESSFIPINTISKAIPVSTSGSSQ